MIEKRGENLNREKPVDYAAEALEYIGIKSMNFQLEHQENLFQWK